METESRLTLNIGMRYDLPIFPIYGSSQGANNTNNLVGDLDLNNGGKSVLWRRGVPGRDSVQPGTVVDESVDSESLLIAMEFWYPTRLRPEYHSDR